MLSTPLPAGFGGLPARDGDLLPVDDAFVIDAPVWIDGALHIGWAIAPDCYLYRDRIAVEVLSPRGYALGPAQWPQAQLHVDAQFGEVRILRDRVRLSYRPAGGPTALTLRVRYQGCADGTVCYPPQTREFEVGRP